MTSTITSISNGRVDIKSPNTCDLFALYDKIPAHQCTTLRNPTEGLWDDTTLSKLFFSQNNVQIIQNGIRAGVFKQSGGRFIIGSQDCDSLKIVMRSVFLQFSANKSDNITDQIHALNQLVLNYCVPQVYSEAKGYTQYLVDASSMYKPIDHPVQTKNLDKELVFNGWF